ncbi:histidine phosphatase superfamily [Massariosphaeria phaeospora]|uniref:Histidine phosphatase superfamily n=1 Tax=Massariosphaeria phaeospora TaxID=100035 RepID=A0A7C8IFF8_9PLEO|nr:histidine phosphatase superfamily [Massariosphaeria phaeospora]
MNTKLPPPVRADASPNQCLIHVIRHGESLHNIDRGYPYRDPPLTEAGYHATANIRLPVAPDLILISPMTRTIQTALNAFSCLRDPELHVQPEVQIWPDLREAHDAICNKGLGRADMQSKFPQFDFSHCPEAWDYAPHTVEGASDRAETVRLRLKLLAATHKNIAVLSHRGFIAFLVKGRRFGVCESRTFRFASIEEAQDVGVRMGVHCETLHEQDFGPTVLVLLEEDREEDHLRGAENQQGE